MENTTTYNKPQGVLPKGPRGTTLLKLASLVQSEPLETYRFIHHKYGDVVYCPFPSKPVVFVTNPRLIKQILRDNHTNYTKSKEYVEMKPLLGQGLLTSEGKLWREMRKIMAKEFHISKVKDFIPLIDKQTKKRFRELELNKELDLSQVFMKLTLELACNMFFGVKDMEQAKVIEEVLDYETVRVSKTVKSPFNLPYSVPTPKHIRSKYLISQLDKMVEKIINKGSEEINVLSRLLQQQANLPHKQIRDEVVTLMLAGHETTSNALTWTVYNLVKHPEWITKIREELEERRPISYEDFDNCIVLKSVFLEAMRLYPPAPLISRTAIADDVFEEKLIPKGATIAIASYVTHRDPRYWADPDNFNPQRFIERKITRDDYTYFPFARGARSCIGESLAMAEGLIILSQFFETFDVQMDQNFDPNPKHHITLRPMNGLIIKLKERVS